MVHILALVLFWETHHWYFDITASGFYSDIWLRPLYIIEWALYSLRLKIMGQTRRASYFCYFRRLGILHSDDPKKRKHDSDKFWFDLSVWGEKLLGYNKKNPKTGGEKIKNVCLGIDSNLLNMPLIDVSLISECCSLCKWCLQQACGGHGVHWRN